MEQHYLIAGLTILMDTFGRNERQAEPYRCAPAEPDFIIRTDWRELQQTQPLLNDEECEYLSAGKYFSRQLIRFNGLFLHASAVVVDDRAYLFSAPSGTGKSTHTGLWLKTFGDRAYILNDDKPALRFVDGVWYAYGTPWSGKYDISVNARVKVGGICLLHQAEENTIRRITGSEAVFHLLDQTFRPVSARPQAMLLENLDNLLTHVPVWELGCNTDPQAAIVAYNAMAGE